MVVGIVSTSAAAADWLVAAEAVVTRQAATPPELVQPDADVMAERSPPTAVMAAVTHLVDAARPVFRDSSATA